MPVGVDQDPHLRLTRDITQKTNWFNVKKRKSGGLTVALSVQEDNQAEMGFHSGRIDMILGQSSLETLSTQLLN